MEIDFGKCPNCGGIKKCVAALEKNHDTCHGENEAEHKSIWKEINIMRNSINGKIGSTAFISILGILLAIAGIMTSVSYLDWHTSVRELKTELTTVSKQLNSIEVKLAVVDATTKNGPGP